jgi:S-formylglutathione hydrolase FrmB
MTKPCSCLVSIVVVLFLASSASGLGKSNWLTHRTYDPSKLVVNWTTQSGCDSKVRFGLTKDYGQAVHVPANTTLHHVEISPAKELAIYHYYAEPAASKLTLVNATKTLAVELERLAGKALDRKECQDSQQADPTISEAQTDANGFLVHEVRSPYQAGVTPIRVLLPDKLEPGKRYPVVYVLPVEAGNENRYGDGLLEVKKQNLHNKLQAIFVAPTFSRLPWYADHPTKADIRQETYFLKVVAPFIEKAYPVQPGASGRLLLGFSKSGWGAFSLLLRHPDVFGKAAAWDAPLMLTRADRFGMGDIFGTQENFEKYQITKLLEAQADKFQKEKRLILLGYGNFRDHHKKVHALLTDLKLLHEYRDGPARKHDWHSGWVAEAVETLLPAPKDGKSP